MAFDAEVWIVHSRKEVLVQDVAAIPYSAHRGDVEYVGTFKSPDIGWGMAQVIGKKKADELGYTMTYYSILVDD